MPRSLSLRLRALVALSAFVGSLSLPLLSFGHLALDDDTACGSVVMAFGQPGTRVGLPQSSPRAQHCPLCHWLRAVGGAQAAGAVTAVAWLEPGAPAPAVSLVWHPALVVTERPSRAPPAVIG
jgi:hypothetical protein